jgi:hypothetical protein
MDEYKEQYKRLAVSVPESTHFRLKVLARKHYEGRLPMLVRVMLESMLDDLESGTKKMGV